MAVAAPILLSAAVTGIAAASWTAFGLALVLGGLSYALTPKVKSSDVGFGPSSSTLTVRQSDLTHQIAYGHTRVTRGYADIEVTDINDRLHVVLILCQGELRNINEIWLDDYAIPNDWLDADGNVTQGRYAGYLQIKKHTGSEFQVADPLLVLNLPNWTVDHRLQGIAYLYLIMTKNQDVYPNGVPNITAIVEGPSLYDPRVDDMVWSTNIPLFASDYIMNSVYGFGASTDDVDLSNISAQANIADEIVAVDADPLTVTAVDTSTDIITIDGDLLQYEFGDQVQLSSTGSLPTGISAATNYYVVPYQIQTTPRIQLATSLANAMSKTVINITSAGSGVISIEKVGEPRYHGSGVIETEKNLSENLNDIVNCMAGRAINVAGFWTLLAGAWRTPAIEFTIEDMVSGIELQNSLSISDSYNLVKGVYFSQLNYYQTSDYPSAFYQDFVDDDAGIQASKELNLLLCGRPTTAQRIAKIELFRGRQGIVVTTSFNMKALQVQTGDNIYLTVDRYGWDNKPFEVTEYSVNNQNGALTVQMVLRETAEEIFDWSAGEAISFDPAPNTNLPNVFEVMAPSGVSFNSSSIDTQGGDQVFTLSLAWATHPDAFVRQFGDFEVQFKLSSETDYRPSFFVDGELTSTDVVNSSVNIPYDLRVRARNNLGVRSAWTTIEGAVAGSSGGVGTTNDWGAVNDAVGTTNDWGAVNDAVGTTNDWGFVV